MPLTTRVSDKKMAVHCGVLTVKVPSLLKTKLYNDYWCILYTGKNKFSPRIDLYEEKTQVGPTPCKKTIYLEEAKWLKTDSLDSAFSIEVKHSKQFIFITPSRSEVNLWILVLCCVCKDLFDTKHVLGIADLNKMESYQTESEEESVVTDNILYSSSNELATFMVVAAQTESCLQHGWKGPYKLRIGRTDLQLLQYDSEKEVASWSLLSLKKFGHSPLTFFLESGSRSSMGAGRFVFQTTEGGKIVEFLNFGARQLYSQIHQSDNSHVAKDFQGSVKSHTDSVVRPKPPVPPQKPILFRNSMPENTELQGMHLANGHQLSKKGIPPFGIQVFAPLTQQVSNGKGGDGHLRPGEGEHPNWGDAKDLAVSTPHDENNTKPLLTWSTSYQPSESGSKKDGKKAQKEWKREQKKREEEEKKERRRQEEEKKKEMKRRDEEEKKIKKEQKKKQKEAKVRSGSNASASLSDSKVSCTDPEADDLSTYAEVDLAGVTPDSSVFTEKIYSEPWGSLPFIPVQPSGDSNEVEYAQPQKNLSHQPAAFDPREVAHIEHYETVEIADSECNAPLVHPPNWRKNSKDCEDTDVYAHLNEDKSAVMLENVYGMASASSTVQVCEDENPYEEANVSTYECVG